MSADAFSAYGQSFMDTYHGYGYSQKYHADLTRVEARGASYPVMSRVHTHVCNYNVVQVQFTCPREMLPGSVTSSGVLHVGFIESIMMAPCSSVAKIEGDGIAIECTPFTGTGTDGSTQEAAWDKTFNDSGERLRIAGTFVADPI